MFGPDKCGLQSKIHLIVRLKNPKTGELKEYHAKQPEKSVESYFTDKKSHLYRFVLNEDDSYEISVDQVKIMDGNLMRTMEPSIIPDKEIDDIGDKKPETWDEREKIPDPDATKPLDWDENAPKKIVDPKAKQPDDWLSDEPEFLPDEKAIKPDDWDEEMDGKWEAPLIKNPKCEKVSGCGKWTPPTIDNPDYKGPWKAPMISNPNYQGKWKPRKIANPDYFQLDSAFRVLETIGAVGIELWTMTENISFDNFLITDELSVADEFAAKTWGVKRSAESRRAAKSSVFSTLIQTANDKPWLWAVYLLVVLIPIVLITIFCFGSSKDSKGQAKKTDEISPDDVHPGDFGTGEANSDEESQEGDVADEHVPETEDSTASGLRLKRKSKKADLAEKLTKDDLEENSDDDQSGSHDSKKDNSKGPSTPRRVVRKAD